MKGGRYGWRFLTCAIGLAVVLVGMGARLAYLHVGPHDDTLAMLNRSRQWHQQIQVERGKVFDRQGAGNILALDLPVQDVCADPALLLSSGLVVNVASELAPLLQMPADELAVMMNRPGRRYSRLAMALPGEEAARIRAQNLPGIFFEERVVRYYPHRQFMCHVLGFVNHEGIGSAGVEQRMDRFLRGSPGWMEGEKDAFRQPLYWKRGRHVRPLAGADVHLTIDQYVQHIAEKALDGIGAAHDGKLTWEGAWAIVQDVRTGEILAMASRPAFDLNAFRDARDLEKLNRAVGMVFEPGSTLKAITFAAALEERLVTPETVIDCEGGSWYHANHVLRDYSAAGRLTVADGLKKSSNILTAKLAVKMGDARLYEYLRAFGLGDRMGFDLPGEEAGLLRPRKDWSAVSGSRIGIGQGVAVTGLQLISVFSAIANEGVLMRPYVVRKVVAADGSLLHERRPEELGRPITPETARLMARLLTRVTEPDGTGRRARVEGYAVAGKTGTAQKAVAGGYSSTEHVASFVGFLPADQPRIAILVAVDNPQPIRSGGAVAAPVFQAIAAETARYLDLPATAPDLAMR